MTTIIFRQFVTLKVKETPEEIAGKEAINGFIKVMEYNSGYDDYEEVSVQRENILYVKKERE